MANQPLVKFKDGAFNITVWENQTKDGQRTWRSVQLQRNYNKGTEEKPEWDNDNLNLRKSDFIKVRYLLGKVYDYLTTIEGK